MHNYRALAEGLAVHLQALSTEMDAAVNWEEQAALPRVAVEAPAPLLARLADVFADDPPLWKEFQAAVAPGRSPGVLQAARRFVRQAALAAAAVQGALRAWEEQFGTDQDPAARSRALDGVQALRVAQAQLGKMADPGGLAERINGRAGEPLVSELACLALGQAFAEAPVLWRQFRRAVEGARFTDRRPKP